MDREPVTTLHPPLLHRRARTSVYEQVDRVSRVETATPHALVAMLYERLLASLDVLARADGADGFQLCARHHEKATSIIHALQAGLDTANGGDIAERLMQIYGQMNQKLGRVRAGDQRALEEVREGVANLAAAWSLIGQ